MVKASVPNFFMCPISLQLMKDPVTLTTGQTYDRKSIEKWFTEGHNTCPSTMQVLLSRDIAPNHTLQRLIQQWCASNNYCQGGGAVEVIAPVVSCSNEAKRRPVMQILRDLANRGADSHSQLRELRCLARDLDQGSHNKAALVEAGAIPVLASLVFSPEHLTRDVAACEEALAILTLLPLHDIRKSVYIGSKELTAISWFLNRGSIDGRVHAAVLLGSLAHQDTEMKASIGNTAGIFEGLVQLVKEELYFKAVESGLRGIVSIVCEGPERNIRRAVEAGVIFAVVERLLQAQRSSKVQSLMKLMELLCFSIEGREAAISHALMVPLLDRIILSDSPVASESAIACLWTICQHSPSKCVEEAAGQPGILMQLSRLVESGDHRVSATTNERAAQLLRQVRQRLQTCSRRF